MQTVGRKRENREKGRERDEREGDISLRGEIIEVIE